MSQNYCPFWITLYAHVNPSKTIVRPWSCIHCWGHVRVIIQRSDRLPTKVPKIGGGLDDGDIDIGPQRHSHGVYQSFRSARRLEARAAEACEPPGRARELGKSKQMTLEPCPNQPWEVGPAGRCCICSSTWRRMHDSQAHTARLAVRRRNLASCLHVGSSGKHQK